MYPVCCDYNWEMIPNKYSAIPYLKKKKLLATTSVRDWKVDMLE